MPGQVRWGRVESKTCLDLQVEPPVAQQKVSMPCLMNCMPGAGLPHLAVQHLIKLIKQLQVDAYYKTQGVAALCAPPGLAGGPRRALLTVKGSVK